MATFTFPNDGVKVTITNNSVATPVEFEETAFISPTLTSTATASTEIIPPRATVIPAFKSYYKITIQPGDTLEFTAKTKEEALYYKNLKLDSCAIVVTEVTSGTQEEEPAEEPSGEPSETPGQDNGGN